MKLEPETVTRLNLRAREVGVSIGWALAFFEAPNPEYVSLTADTLDDEMESHHVVILSPMPVDDATVEKIETLLDQLERGELQLVPDAEGDPRLG